MESWGGWSHEAGKLGRQKRDRMTDPACVDAIPRNPAPSRTERQPQRNESRETCYTTL